MQNPTLLIFIGELKLELDSQEQKAVFYFFRYATSHTIEPAKPHNIRLNIIKYIKWHYHRILRVIIVIQ